MPFRTFLPYLFLSVSRTVAVIAIAITSSVAVNRAIFAVFVASPLRLFIAGCISVITSAVSVAAISFFRTGKTRSGKSKYRRQ